MSHGSSFSGRQSSRKNVQIQDLQLEFGAITGLPIIPCPRCGDKVLELRSWKNGGEVFFKCRQNDQDVPFEYRKCSFYKPAAEYEPVAVGWARRHGMNLAASGVVAGSRIFSNQLVNKQPDDPRCDDGDAQKKEKLIKLVEWMLLTNVVVALLVSLVVLIMLVK